MTKIENEMQYQVALKRVEELMLRLPEDTPEDDPEMVELTLLGNLVADYDEEFERLVTKAGLRIYRG